MRCVGLPWLAVGCFALACGEASGMSEDDLQARASRDGGGDDVASGESLDASEGSRGDAGTPGEGQGAGASDDREGGGESSTTDSLDDAGLDPDGAPNDVIEVADSAGACANGADLERIAGLTVAELACEGAACAARALQLAFPLAIDAEALQACVDADAPTLADLSVECRACFVAIAQCVPTACVSAFGGQAACTQAPSTSFAACADAAPAGGACAECEGAQCREAFIGCSGLAP